MKEADLTEADFGEAALFETNMRTSNMSRAHFESTALSGEMVFGSNIEGAILPPEFALYIEQAQTVGTPVYASATN